MTTTTPTLTTVTDARAMLEMLAETNDWVSVFWDRGWGDSGQIAEISIIVDGDGQQPKAFITAEVYRELVDRNIIATNSYGGYKARRLHDFKYIAPAPSPEQVAAKARMAAAEKLCRVLLAEIDLPLVVEFGRFGDRQRLSNAPAAGIYVQAIITLSDVIVSPYNGMFGDYPAAPGRPGGAVGVPYPADVEAIGGPEYRAQVERVIRQQYAFIAPAVTS